MYIRLYKDFFACLDGFVKVNLITLHKGRLFGLNFWLFVLFCFFLVAVAFEDLGGCWLSAFCFWFLLLAFGFMRKHAEPGKDKSRQETMASRKQKTTQKRSNPKM